MSSLEYSTGNVSVVKQIVENLQSLTFVREIATGSHDGGRLLCLNNGTLDIATGTLLDHAPEHNLVNKMDVDWNPEAKAPIFMNALNEIFQLDQDREAPIRRNRSTSPLRNKPTPPCARRMEGFLSSSPCSSPRSQVGSCLECY